MIWFILVVVLLVLGWYYLVRSRNYWKDRGIMEIPGTPVFGNNFKMILQRQNFSELVEEIYKKGENHRYCGLHQFFSPTFVVRDPDLIKLVCVKDFDHFIDHKSIISEQSDPIFSKNLFFLKGQRWRDMRNTISPCFTSSKMRQMFALMSECAEQFTKYFVDHYKDEEQFTVELKDIFSRYANDVIASTAFGVRVNSLEKRTNDFYKMGLEIMSFNRFPKIFIFFGFLMAPRLMQFLRIRMFSKKLMTFFQNLIQDTISVRRKHNIVRPDIINVLMEARNEGFGKAPEEEKASDQLDAGFATTQDMDTKPERKIEITYEDMTAHALIFFLAGFDGVSQLMSFAVYELALNLEIQTRLQQEIDEAFEEGGGKLHYNALAKMKYLDMVVTETLRKWPFAVFTDRICNKPYKIPAVDPATEKDIIIEKGAVVWMPVFGIQRDPKFYPDPMRFDPERFSDENRKSINPYTFLPFGTGPRNCIGSRFALLETKALICHFLHSFQAVPVERTQIPLRLAKTFNLVAERGFWIGFRKRIDISRKSSLET